MGTRKAKLTAPTIYGKGVAKIKSKKKSASTFIAVLMPLVAARVGYPACISPSKPATSLSTFPRSCTLEKTRERDFRLIV
ncbi:MAG TPA: hypothetical protein VEG44_02920 [Candidatus Acidoferrales bacterium]|nr:hypothetical protein [Candidatus Acidoferrales bacterium]